MTDIPKPGVIIKLENHGYGIINNTGYLDVIKDGKHDKIILDGTENTQVDKLVNDGIFETREALYNKIEGIRVGDYIRLNTNKLTRVTHIWNLDDKTLVQAGGNQYGQYYLDNGCISYSGGLDPGIDASELKPTDETHDGRIWFFKDNYWGAGRGIDYTMKFRVFKQLYPGESA